MQGTLQRIQQAYLGTRTAPSSCSKAGTPRARAASCGASAGRSIRAASRSTRSPRPSEREKSLHYLQRFWERLPQHGQIVVFDRSWYGRVLVERVEGFATRTDGGAPTRRSTSSSAC